MEPGEQPSSFHESAGGRTFSESGLDAVFELNRFLLDLLRNTAIRPWSEIRSQLPSTLGAQFSELTDDARDRLARAPISLVDGGFRDDSRWAALVARPDVDFPGENVFPHLQALQLAHQTLTLAWTTARVSREGARIIFGMSRRCADVVARAGIQTMQRVAERHPNWVRPAWDNQPEIWRHLIAMATQEPQPRLPPVALRALQQRLADLEPATPESDETRSTHR
jgi:hypothetical protein